jgi:ABC-type branched-subunit amino acid transport system ATPase component
VSSAALLSAEGLTKRFGGVAAVEDCTFSVPTATITALVGPNGSGRRMRRPAKVTVPASARK